MRKLKERRNKVIFFMSVLTIAILVWYNLGSYANAADSIVIKVGSPQPEGHFLVQYVYIPWCKEVEKRSNGAVKFKWYHAGSLIKFNQNIDALKSGMVEMVDTMGTWIHEAEFPVTSLLHLPFMFTSNAQANHVYQEAYETIPEFKKEYGGLKMIGFHNSDLTNFHWVRGQKAAKSLAELKGKRLYIAGGTGVKALELLGATPRIAKHDDVYIMAQRKAVDGIVFNTAPLAKWKMDEVTNAHSLVFLNSVTLAGAMNQKFFDSLPAKVKDIIDELRPSWTRLAAAIVDNRREATIRALKKRGDEIYAFTSAQRAEMRKMVQPIIDEWFKRVEAKGIDPQPIFDKFMALVKKYENYKYPDDPWWPKDWRK